MRITVFLLCAASALPAAADQWSKNFNTGAQPDLYVTTTDGNVTIRTSPGSVVDARVVTAGWRIAPGEVTISDRQTGNRVELEVRLPRFHMDVFNFHDRWVRIELQVPEGTQADIHTTDGNIVADGLRGKTRLITHDGNIEGHQLDGALEASSGDGNVRVRGRFDGLNLSSGDGNIEAEVSPGSRMATGWSVHTGDGRVTLRLPDGFAANVDAHTGDGKITLDLPFAANGTLRENSVSGKLNGGGPSLTIHTGDGSIHLERL
jgi:hypothetical protein